jgi:hypothetical protein
MKLTIGNIYKVTHKRKGVFVGQLIDIVDAEPGDTEDYFFWQFKYDVRAGTDQERLAINPGKDSVRVSNIRPSLVTNVELFEGEHWLRAVAVKEEQEPQEATGFLGRLRHKRRS